MSDLADYKYRDEALMVKELARALDWSTEDASSVSSDAARLIASARTRRRKPGEIETFLREYGLNTEEGKALITLAEALLRIPDAGTANELIKDKVDSAAWPNTKTDDWMLKATALGMKITKKTLHSLIGRLGEPVVRTAVRQAMRIMGRQFVMGRTIEEAVKNARAFTDTGAAMSYDMLGEGARTAEDADIYFAAYREAIESLKKLHVAGRSGISVKLSALTPRYSFAHKDSCVPFLAQRLKSLCLAARDADIRLTVDAEEADRLDISLEIFKAVALSPELKGWAGLGLAVQAYQKRALKVIDSLTDFAKERGTPFHIRLVKGAYWDSEIKHAQVMGLPDYSVYTRKNNTDLSYLACAKKMLAARPAILCLFGTHNAHTIAALLHMAGEAPEKFELQRLHGMGENLFGVMEEERKTPYSIYAPVGKHEDLLPYLVRRLLENGANSSFVHKIFDEKYEPEELVTDIVERALNHSLKRHPKIPLPVDIFQTRENSQGRDLSDAKTVSYLSDVLKETPSSHKTSTVGEKILEVCSPSNRHDVLARLPIAGDEEIAKAFEVAQVAFPKWRESCAEKRAVIFEKAADLLEERFDQFFMLAVKEAGKTWGDAVAEIREAVDFCRYYAQQDRVDFDRGGIALPGVTGESNTLFLKGRGTFVCISPWNFPLAIFTGQIVAALMAGNCVICKPAEQTPLIAREMVGLLYEAGVPEDVLHCLVGAGDLGAKLVAHKDVAGVAFTGSTDVARLINRTLAGKDGPIVPLIAETGGLNALVVDSSALTEQVVDDTILSAFGSAGQRCSALRILCVQDDVADKTIHMLKGAIAELEVGDPAHLVTDIGPVIDDEARHNLLQHIEKMNRKAWLLGAARLSPETESAGYYVAPHAFEIPSLDMIEKEVFGPVLHVYRYAAKDRAKVIEALNAKGYGLTFGVHSRISTNIEKISGQADVGNVYVNRSIIGAVVGSQPFGGRGLSGTGPKAGGPFYLHRFATEKVVSINTTASGGNTTLVSLED
ncbi:MAG: bifunctional proline dehydrogenase/L-glutamate gamma-semialdehyde dehydrogenase PutA [Pseudobdellovibrionaceae bacterium]